MNQITLPEEPLFLKKKKSNIESDLSLEEIKERANINRKDKLLRFSFKSFYIMTIVILIIIIFDALEQKFGIDTELLSQTFELIKYSTTTILGFLFASNSK